MQININVENEPDDPDLLIPIGIVWDGNINISCYQETLDLANRIAECINNDTLSDSVISEVKSSLDSLYCKRGYFMDSRFPEIDYVGILKNFPARGKYTSARGKDVTGMRNLTEIDIDEAVLLGQESFVCVADGAIVSVAVENFLHDGAVEIAVETAEAYRGKGYAYSVCADLICDIISAGYFVTWHCNEDNIESVNLANKLGFVRAGRELYYCYYLNRE